MTTKLTALFFVAALGIAGSTGALATTSTTASGGAHHCPANDSAQVKARAAQYQMEKPISLLSKCGLGGLLSPHFGIGFSLTNLINNLENKACGLVQKSTSKVTDQINHGVGQINQYGNDISNITKQAEQGNVGPLKNVPSVSVAPSNGQQDISVNVGSDSQNSLQQIYQNLFK